MSAHESVKKGQPGRLDNRNRETELSNSNGENAWPSKVPMHQPEEEKMVDPGLALQAFPLKEDAAKTERGLETGGSDSPLHSYTKQVLDYRGRPASKSTVGGSKSSIFILGMQFASTLAYAGTVTNLVLYLTDKLHESNASAASNVNNWSGAVYLCSLIGAFFGDAYWGRYLTSVIFLFIYLTGMILSTVSVSLPSLRPPDCTSGSATCQRASTKQAGFFFFSIYVQALGCGAFQPCNTAFGADQFDEDDPKEVIQKSKYFSWLYLSSSAGALIGNSVIVYLEEHQGYKLGFSISTAALGLSLLLYIAGTPLYRYEKLGDNPFTRVFQVPIAAIRKNRVQVPQDVSLLYQAEEKQNRVLPHTSQFRFLDKAATITNNEERNPWQLCTVTQVEEVKCLIRLMPIWATGIFFSTTYNQILTLFVEQGSAMDTHMGNPRGITMLQRQGVGLVLSVLAVVIAAIVEIKRLQIIKHHGLENDTTTTVPMSVFWLTPPFMLIGASEVFTFIGQYEFFYDQAPDALRGLGSGLELSCFAMGSFLSSGLVSAVTSITKRGNNPGWISDNLNNGHLDYFYWLLVVLGILNFLLYLISARWYKYRTIEGVTAYEKLTDFS
ncbi:hypothetical protein O6H91_07G076300 [Diphasiastrum complanatum]|uniref:Uncharacterized protein n=1 Tax=Diphasiastrum complanatum TaxID=34168 RepID=A0ACC2D720_DIPCM|nr:hypothetical protein O6H91_07G076300 [Diphasiastrum complanatum]